MGQNTTEVELKISLSLKDLEKVFKSLHRKAGKPRVNHKYLPRVYYDTANLDLYRRRQSLRVQYKPGKAGVTGGYEQTVKFEISGKKIAQAHGTLARKEIKNKISSHQPDVKAITDPEAESLFKAYKNKDLINIFTAAIERRSFNMKLGAGKKQGVVEVAFDVGELILPAPDGAHHPFSEIEIELKRGSAEAIDELHKRILKMASSARIQPLSKSDQGTRLYKSVFRKGRAVA